MRPDWYLSLCPHLLLARLLISICFKSNFYLFQIKFGKFRAHQLLPSFVVDCYIHHMHSIDWTSFHHTKRNPPPLLEQISKLNDLQSFNCLPTWWWSITFQFSLTFNRLFHPPFSNNIKMPAMCSCGYKKNLASSMRQHIRYCWDHQLPCTRWITRCISIVFIRHILWLLTW